MTNKGIICQLIVILPLHLRNRRFRNGHFDRVAELGEALEQIVRIETRALRTRKIGQDLTAIQPLALFVSRQSVEDGQ